MQTRNEMATTVYGVLVNQKVSLAHPSHAHLAWNISTIAYIVFSSVRFRLSIHLPPCFYRHCYPRLKRLEGPHGHGAPFAFLPSMMFGITYGVPLGEQARHG